ncbi:hypothetical protein GF325_16720 [Candidatus Bathyarchaeota archaeon]|nr:hypothetical protein [Candidatus Bathyarchaeota archaeon]
MVNEDILKQISANWTKQEDIIESIHLLKEMIEEVKSYGTWSYDFPEVMKLIAVTASTAIPFIIGVINDLFKM